MRPLESRPRSRAVGAAASARAHGRLLAVLGGALALRLLVLALTPGYKPTGDPADYDRHAVWLSLAGTYPPTAFAEPGGASALRPPGYPYLLAAVYEVTGERWTAGRLAGALLGVLAVLLLWAVVRRVWGDRIALWAAGIAAVAPTLVWLNGALIAETLFVPLVLAVLLCALAYRDRPRAGLALAAGALCGAAVLTRTNGLVLLVPLMAALLAVRPRWRGPALAAVAFALVLTPWTVRNAGALDRFLPLGTQSGYTIAGQYNSLAATRDDFWAAWRVPQDVPELKDLFQRPGTDEGEVDAELRRRALDFAGENPDHVVGAAAINALRLFDLGSGRTFVSNVSYTEMGIPERHRGVVRLGVLALLALALWGAVRLRRRESPRGPWWLWAFPLLLYLSVLPFLGAPRYRAPVDPFLAILAAIAVVHWRDRRRTSRAAPSGPPPAG